jgi:hypothetical protein
MTDWAPLLTRVRGEEVDAFTGYRLEITHSKSNRIDIKYLGMHIDHSEVIKDKEQARHH